MLLNYLDSLVCIIAAVFFWFLHSEMVIFPRDA